MSATVNQLLTSALQEGSLSPTTFNALSAPDLGVQIQAALGVPVDHVQSSEVLLLTMLVDDSGSIDFVKGNTEAVRMGHNLVLDALTASKQGVDILAHTRYLNGFVLFPYSPIDQAIRMTPANYDPSLGTPLYDQTAVTLGTVLAKIQDFARYGVPVRSVTLIITDGADLHSVRQTAATVRPMVEDLLRAETNIVAAMGITDGVTDFRRVFTDMGVPDEWILTPANTDTEIRKAFRVFSQSSVQAYKSGSFSRSALGGFGTP